MLILVTNIKIIKIHTSFLSYLSFIKNNLRHISFLIIILIYNLIQVLLKYAIFSLIFSIRNIN